MNFVGEADQRGEIGNMHLVLVIASKPGAGGIEKAQKLGIPVEVVPRKEFDSSEAFGDALLRVLKNYGVDFVSQNGWLPLTPAAVIEAYKGRIVNQHPAPLDPGRKQHHDDIVDFGGKGMYGDAAVCARIAYSMAVDSDYWTQSTVHAVTPNFDEGDLISVMDVPLELNPMSFEELEENSEYLKELTSRFHEEVLLPVEHKNVVKALRDFGKKERLITHRRHKPLVPGKHKDALIKAQVLAVKLFPKG